MNNPAPPPFKDALKFWIKLGWISFGGTAGHIALMHDYLVDKRKWISSSRFFHALSICMLLPGPEAQQLAIYIGGLLHGKKGGVLAGILFVLPSTLILIALCIVYVLYGNIPWISSMFNGLKPVVIALITMALYKIGKKALHGTIHIIVALVAFVCIFFFNISLLKIIIATIFLGLMVKAINPSWLHTTQTKEQVSILEDEYYISKNLKSPNADFTIVRLLKQVFIFLIFWFAPIISFFLLFSDFIFWKTLILFFTQTAFFTIGGSYTVLPYVAQFAVAKLSWLTKMQMVDGFALAETTPGPLIIVVGFVGFMAAYHHFGFSLWMGCLGLLITIYYTFLPCFLLIFAGGSLIEKTNGNTTMNSILGLVTAAVVGVICNLVIFLGKDVLFPQGNLHIHQVDYFALSCVVISCVLLEKFRLSVVYLIILSLLIGVVHFFLI